jgi:hypothetical protein
MEKKESTQVKECQTCKKGLSKSQIGLIFFSMYIFASAIYGTYKLIENLINVF